MPKELYYSIGGQQYGPVTAEYLRQLVASGRLGPNDHVFNDRIREWIPVCQIASLSLEPGTVPSEQLGAPASNALEQLAVDLAAERLPSAGPRTRGGSPPPTLSRGNWVGIIVVVIVLVWILGAWVLRGTPSESNFDAVHIGMTNADVIGLMGEPDLKTFTGGLQQVYIFNAVDGRHEFVVMFDYDHMYTDVLVVVDKQRRVRRGAD